MTIQQRKKSLIFLGKFLSQFTPKGIFPKENIPHNDIFIDVLTQLIDRAHESNPWFTRENVLYALSSWADALQAPKIDQWLDNYRLTDHPKSKKIGVIMAGNIPLVGMHDFISVLASGHQIKAKLSSSDKYLLPVLAKYLIYLEPEFKDKISFTEATLEDIEAVIATGSNNTARYFDYYFGKYPHIIRKNKNSVAVLTGNETTEELEGLADDIMLYFGLGCRNVSKIFVPEAYDFNHIFKAILKYKDLINYQKYAHNYDYNKAVYLMSVDEHIRNSLLDNGLILLKKDVHYSSPIGTVFYEPYKNINDVNKILEKDIEQIQAIVSHAPEINNRIAFGNTQRPELWDYADAVDTMEFLTGL